jgi:hypothetical protein
MPYQQRNVCPPGCVWLLVTVRPASKRVPDLHRAIREGSSTNTQLFLGTIQGPGMDATIRPVHPLKKRRKWPKLKIVRGSTRCRMHQDEKQQHQAHSRNWNSNCEEHLSRRGRKGHVHPNSDGKANRRTRSAQPITKSFALAPRSICLPLTWTRMD